MSKKEIKAALKQYGYKVIKPSWYRTKKDECVLVIAYDDHGLCYQYFINYGKRYASRTLMTDTGLRLESTDVSFMFWG